MGSVGPGNNERMLGRSCSGATLRGFDAETRATASSREGVSPKLRREAAQLPETGRTGCDSPRGPGPWL